MPTKLLYIPFIRVPLKNPFTNVPQDSKKFKWMLLAGTAIIFAATFYSSTFPNHFHAYKINDIAKEDIKAPTNFLIDDISATEERREEAAQEALTVYDKNDRLSGQVKQRLEVSFETARKELTDKKKPGTAGQSSPVNGGKEKFESLLGITVSKGAYNILEKELFSKTIETLIGQIVSEILDNGVTADKEALLKDKDKGIILSYVSSGEEEVVSNIKILYSLDQALSMVRIIGEPLLNNMDYNVKNLIVDFSQRFISPNITLNASKTEQIKTQARENIKPILYEIKKGEMLLREGQKVTEQDLMKLNRLQSEAASRVSASIGIGAALLSALVIIVVFLRNTQSKQKSVLADNRNKLFFATMLCLSFLAVRFSLYVAQTIEADSSFSAITSESIFLAIPLASSAMIVCLFMNIDLTASFALILALCAGAIFGNKFELFVFSVLNLTMAAYWMQHCRERKVFVKAGAKLGLFNMAVIIALDLYLGEASATHLAVDGIMAFSGGLLSGILTAGLAPIIEMVFDYTTDIKLLELSNLDQPLLKKLMLEAPGTYHHSLVVGSMVEAAASEVDANPLLARVGGYYHDIGKVRHPDYFIENQKDSKNKHEALAPSMSSLILMKHVKYGVEIAQEYKLGDPIIAAIEQHHGTNLIAYFYEKAKKHKKEENGKYPGKEKEINEADFRYPGPRPQTREAGLVMLADIVEAAARTLESPTPARLQGLIQDLINRTFSDGQLNECELTLKDLNSIARSFYKILAGIYHHRIEYPGTTNGKNKNVSADNQPSKKSSSASPEDNQDSPGPLKRRWEI